MLVGQQLQIQVKTGLLCWKPSISCASCTCIAFWIIKSLLSNFPHYYSNFSRVYTSRGALGTVSQSPTEPFLTRVAASRYLYPFLVIPIKPESSDRFILSIFVHHSSFRSSGPFPVIQSYAWLIFSSDLSSSGSSGINSAVAGTLFSFRFGIFRHLVTRSSSGHVSLTLRIHQ